MSIKVSIIVPIYNQEPYLEPCLQSLVAQTLQDIEIIAINDGSTDKSLEILQKFAHRDYRIKIIDQENQGTGRARNRGVEQAQGDYLGFVDADDWIDGNYFEELYKQAKAESADICCALKCKEVNGNKEVITTTPYFEDIEKFKKQLIMSEAHLWSKIFKRKWILDEAIINIKSVRSQDIAFSIVAILQAQGISVTRNTYYHYRVLQSSASHRPLMLKNYEELASIFQQINTYEYHDKKMAKSLILGRLNNEIHYYLGQGNFQQRVILFLSVIKNFPNFKWNDDYRISYTLAKFLKFLGI